MHTLFLVLLVLDQWWQSLVGYPSALSLRTYSVPATPPSRKSPRTFKLILVSFLLVTPVSDIFPITLYDYFVSIFLLSLSFLKSSPRDKDLSVCSVVGK